MILPHKFQDAEKFNLQFSDFSEITETADKLRWLRYQKGLRQRDVADYAGIYRSTYIHYEEYGKDFYSPKHMEKIAQLFEVPVERLLDDYNLFLRNGQGKQIKAIRMKLGLTQREYEAYLVGGAVRDYVRDNSPAKDWDITTNALPEQVEEIFTGYHLIETGLKHGTVTVVIDQEPLEITTYRVDGDYSDHRHPDSVSFTRSLKDDLERRDFTMNALAYNPRTGVVDFVGGKADIAGDLVRCVGDPDRRFQEDGLRMLRALRFASVYGMTIEAATAAAIHRNKHLLKGIAAERILVELTKMLCAQGAAGVLRDFADVLAVPIPELTPMFGFAQHNPHHDKDVWDHTIAVIESITPEPVLRWAALLHDIGKPSCFSLAEDGIGHFFGHSDQSTSMAESILSRLRFDNASKEQIVRLVRYHDMPITADRKPIKRLLSKHGEDATRQLIELHKADTLGQSAICRHRIAIFEEVSQMINEILQEESCFTLKDLAANGHDMMTLGFQGPTIGRVLQECLDAVLDEQIPNEHEALMTFAKDRQLKS